MVYEFSPYNLYYGDCLEIMRNWPGECVDLIYLDPPFNSDVDYNILFSNEAPEENGRTQIAAFEDTWWWSHEASERVESLRRTSTPTGDAICAMWELLGRSGAMSYLSYMALRLEQCHRLLKPTASIYLHCDPTMGHYLKMLMDKIFGTRNFRREIIWNLQTSSGYKTRVKGWVRGHDTILYYTRNHRSFVFHKQYQPHKPEYIARFKKIDADGGKYRDDRPGRRRQYLDQTPGVAFTDVWSDIMPFQQQSTSAEYLGYRTQKPLALLRRIILSSSEAGYTVLDPFGGCGTTVAAADELDRKWLGIDIAFHPLHLTKTKRLSERRDGREIEIHGEPHNLEDAIRMIQERSMGRRRFETWSIEIIDGMRANQKKVADRGFDGKGYIAHPLDETKSQLVLAQAKSGDFAPGQLRDFCRVVQREEAAFGVYITLRKLRGTQMRNAQMEIADMGQQTQGAASFPRLQLWSVEEFFAGRMPQLPVLAHPETGKPLSGPLL